MAYVSVPKDLTKVKNKVAFNLTRRQIICFAAAAAVGLPFYFLTRDLIGGGNAMMGMIVLMVPAFLFAMYERDGMPLEKILANMITVKFKRPHLRLYETENLYEKTETKPVQAGKTKKRRKKKTVGKKKKKAAGGAGNLGRNMDAARSARPQNLSRDTQSSAGLERRNAQAGVHAAAQRGGRNRARQG